EARGRFQSFVQPALVVACQAGAGGFRLRDGYGRWVHGERPGCSLERGGMGERRRVSVAILNERARHFEAQADAPRLSLKCMLRGEARYGLGRREVAVGHGQCLLLNQGTPYRIAIDSAEVVESFVVFFDPGWVASAWRVETLETSVLLDDPMMKKGRETGPRFDETLQPLDGNLAALRA